MVCEQNQFCWDDIMDASTILNDLSSNKIQICYEHMALMHARTTGEIQVQIITTII